VAATLNADKRSKTVMAVDDSGETLIMLKEIIVGAGYNFVAARSGEHCLSRIGDARPSFILLDVQMPDMDGFELCRRIRAIDEFRDVPIAFLTVCKTEEDLRSGMAAGGNDFMAKPFNVKTLLRHIDHWAFRRVARERAL
jgi:two-component system OmpR family response regulator